MTGAASQWTDEQFYHLLKDVFPTPQEQESNHASSTISKNTKAKSPEAKKPAGRSSLLAG